MKRHIFYRFSVYLKKNICGFISLNIIIIGEDDIYIFNKLYLIYNIKRTQLIQNTKHYKETV